MECHAGTSSFILSSGQLYRSKAQIRYVSNGLFNSSLGFAYSPTIGLTQHLGLYFRSL